MWFGGIVATRQRYSIRATVQFASASAIVSQRSKTATGVAQSCTLLVSVRILAPRDDFWSAEFIPLQRRMFPRRRRFSGVWPVRDAKRTEVRAPFGCGASRAALYRGFTIRGLRLTSEHPGILTVRRLQVDDRAKPAATFALPARILS